MDLFLASLIYPDKKLKQIYLEIKRILRGERVKFYPFEQFFLIYRYLPQTEVEFISDINRLIATQLQAYKIFSINIQGVDIYPYLIMPRVLWFRIEQNPTLMAMAKDLDTALRNFGYQAETFEFYPHITFARIRKIENQKKLELIQQKYQTFEPIEFTIDQVMLIQSIPTNKGNQYKVRNRFYLKK